MRCEDRGEDLLARALGQLDPSAVPGLEEHLRDCAACRAEASLLEGDVRRAAEASEIEPPADGLARLLASVADEAGERRAAAAVATSKSCADLREEVVALAIGSLAAEDRARVEAHVAACAPCADERAVAGRLVDAQRASPAVPVPAGGLARLLASVRGDATSIPVPPALPTVSARRRASARWLRIAVPSAAAAAVFAAILASGDGRIAARIDSGGPAVLRDTSSSPIVPPAFIDARTVRDLAADWDLAAGSEPVELALGLGRDPGDAAAPETDEVRITLLPGARLATVDRRALELHAGRVVVHAGPLRRPLEIRAGNLFARVVGTRFEGARVGDRLVVQVDEGEVELGRRTPDVASSRLRTGRRGLVGPGRLVEEDSDARDPVEALLAPVARLTGPEAPIGRGEALVLDAEIACGPGGPVSLAPFDASEPRFLVRLKGPDGREREVKVLPSMIDLPDGVPAGPLAVRIDDDRPYRLRVRIPFGDALRDAGDPSAGPWEARFRYHAYRPRQDGAEWLGTVESPPVAFHVRSE